MEETKGAFFFHELTYLVSGHGNEDRGHDLLWNRTVLAADPSPVTSCEDSGKLMNFFMLPLPLL